MLFFLYYEVFFVKLARRLVHENCGASIAAFEIYSEFLG